MNKDRRSFLAAGLRLSLGVTLVHSASTRAALCVDPEELGSADYQFRKYVEYTEASKDADKICGGCRYFKPSQDECGSCQVVAGRINSHGHCTSWEARIEKR